MKKNLALSLILVCSSFCLNSLTWHIKQDGTGNFITIQEGIDTSTDSDTVLVYPGTYFENINYNGKNITVASLEIITGNPQYIPQTIIDGQRITSCVSIVSEEIDTCLRGLTITNGQGEIDYPNLGGGISIFGDSDLLVQCDIIKCQIIENFGHISAGILVWDGCVSMSGCSIRNNYSINRGGGVSIFDHSQVVFDSQSRCSIYDNFACTGLDLLVESIHFDFLDVVVDTFSIADPDRYFAQYYSNDDFVYNFDILNYTLSPIDNDLFVSPDGDDNNTGLTDEEPLKTINLAVRKIASNINNPRTIYLASGIYSLSENQQLFALSCKSYVNLIGENTGTTIIDGENNYYPLLHIGPGYYNSKISNLTFQNANYRISPVSFSYSDSIKFENIIVRDATITRGAGINSLTAGGNIELENVIVDNITVMDGGNSGGWFNGTTSFRATNCTFSNNSSIGSSGYSAGLYVMSNENIIIENCKIFNNSTTSTTWEGRASALMCVTSNDEMGDTYINNCLFYNNENINGVSTILAISLVDGMVHFTNNAVVDNQNEYGIEFKGNIEFTNNIIRNDSSDEILLNIIEPNVYSTLDVLYSNIDGGINAIHNAYGVNTINWLEGNIDEDPLFLLTGDDPYQLTGLSPCIDTGTPDTTGLFLPFYDLLNNERVWDGDNNGTAVIDMGCYEYGAEPYLKIKDHEIPISSPNITNLTNFPNPFNPSTTIKFSIGNDSEVELSIFNIKGQKIKNLIQNELTKGNHSIIWNGVDEFGKPISSGIYYYKLSVNGKTEVVKKCLLLK